MLGVVMFGLRLAFRVAFKLSCALVLSKGSVEIERLRRSAKRIDCKDGSAPRTMGMRNGVMPSNSKQKKLRLLAM